MQLALIFLVNGCHLRDLYPGCISSRKPPKEVSFGDELGLSRLTSIHPETHPLSRIDRARMDGAYELNKILLRNRDKVSLLVWPFVAIRSRIHPHFC